MTPRKRAILAGAVAALLTIVAGRWGLSLFTESEFVHFSVNFPTEPGLVTIPVADLPGPWARLPEDEWRGYPAGGLLVWGREGEVVVDIGSRGLLKRLLQPSKLLLSTHWLRNIGPTPRRIRLELDLCGLELEWVTFERDWDPASRTSTRAVAPTRTFNMDWIVHLPAPRRERPLICSGALHVYDADGDRLLTRLPLRIENSRAMEGAR